MPAWKSALDETRPLLYTHEEIRELRAVVAEEHVIEARATRSDREVVNWGAEVAKAARVTPGSAADDDVAAGARLLELIFRHHPGPWRELQVSRCRSSGGMWAFGRQALGDLLVASHDVEARRLDHAPTLQWLSERGVVALADFLGLEPFDPEA